MTMRILLPAVAALTLLSAAPASAQYAPYWGYAPQGGGGAGPYALQCQRFHNYNQREECTEMAMAGRYYGYRGRYGYPGYYGRYFGGW